MPSVQKHHAFPIGCSWIPAGFAKASEYWEAVPMQCLCSLLVCSVWAQRLLARTALTQPKSTFSCWLQWRMRPCAEPVLTFVKFCIAHTHVAGQRNCSISDISLLFPGGVFGSWDLGCWFAKGSALRKKGSGHAAPCAVFASSILSLPCLCPRAAAPALKPASPPAAFLKSWLHLQGALVYLISN